jgi:3-hydroxyisobutyrate dehydrogenase/glyoxylate/succinic semialdehyde reductase
MECKVMKIGVIGLGIMGSRMAGNLQESGHDLIVYNRTREKAEPLVANGATAADSPAGVARQVDLLFTMLADPAAVQETAVGPDGFLAHLRPNALWVDCSTVNPSFSRQMAERARARQVRFVDAPVAGSKGAAETGELLFIVGGDEADVDECQPYFDVMGRETLYAGETGSGSALKMVANLLLAEAMVAFSEAMALGQAMGISRQTLFDVLLNAPVVAPFVAGKRAKIESNDYEADFPLQWMQKDLHLAAVTAYEEEVALPVGNSVKELYALAKRQGLAEEDFSAIYRLLNRPSEEWRRANESPEK